MKFIYDIPLRKQPATQELESGKEWAIMLPFGFVRDNGEFLFVPPSGLGDDATILETLAWTTDYGSIPKAVQSIFSPMRYGGAYLLHDWLYASEKFSREECDHVLLEALEAQGAGWWARHTIHKAVRAGAWVAWNKHNKKRVTYLKAWGELCRATTPTIAI